MYIAGYFTPAGSRKDHCRQRDMDSVRGVLGVLGPGDAVILEHPDLMVEYSSECASGEKGGNGKYTIEWLQNKASGYFKGK